MTGPGVRFFVCLKPFENFGFLLYAKNFFLERVGISGSINAMKLKLTPGMALDK